MATAIERLPRDDLGSEQGKNMGLRTVPIIQSNVTPTIKMSAPSPAGDPMDITTPTHSSAGPLGSDRSPEDDGSDTTERAGVTTPQGDHTSGTSSSSASMPAPAVAAAAVHQPKIVQTAFIHKLYNMLEDPNIQHLISWAPTNDSFVMTPSADFSKVLAQYFKHTNVSSFVRQLNMYGFHKVSDVFHTGSPDTALWEFKHGQGNFKRGDLGALREIKRRASRHALVHREFNNQKPPSSQPGTPAEPMPPIPDSADPRIIGVDHSYYDLNQRLQRSEETAHYMFMKQQAMMDMITRLLHFNQELTRTFLALVPNPNDQIHRDVVALQGEVQRQAEVLRSVDEPPPEPPLSSSRQYFANLDNPPVSPRQLAQDDQRRLNVPQSRGANFYRPPVPSNLSIGARRSIGGTMAGEPPSSSPLRPQPPPPRPGPHPLANVELPPSSLARRHTSADIRAHGWQNQPGGPFGGSGPPSSQWPSSPSRPGPEDQRIRESLSSYSLQGASQQAHSRPTTPPAPPFSNGLNGMDALNNWNWSSAANRENKNLSIRDHSGPPTRRGSMAHILNPTDTAERDDEDDPRGEDDRKRKRMQ